LLDHFYRSSFNIQKDVLGFRGVDQTYAQIRKDLTRLSVNYLMFLNSNC